MSTKIYNAFRLAPGTDVFEFAQRARAAANPVRDRLDAALLAQRAAALVDQAALGVDTDAAEQIAEWGALTAALFGHEDAQRTMRAKGRSNEVWYDPHSLTVALGKDPATGRLLGIALTDRQELADAVLALDGVEDYHFQNSTERPDEVTEREWDERCAAWDRVLPGAGVVALSMLTFALRTENDIDYELARSHDDKVHPAVRAALPSRRARLVERLTVLVAERLVPRPGPEADDETRRTYASAIMGTVFEARQIARAATEADEKVLVDLTDERLLSRDWLDPAVVGERRETLAAIADRLAAARAS